ncbi:hypothetical protein D3C72_2298380 [compost metagenome]
MQVGHGEFGDVECENLYQQADHCPDDIVGEADGISRRRGERQAEADQCPQKSDDGGKVAGLDQLPFAVGSKAGVNSGKGCQAEQADQKIT